LSISFHPGNSIHNIGLGPAEYPLKSIGMDPDYKKLFDRLIDSEESPKNENAKSHSFWNTQPVPQGLDDQRGNSEIEPDSPYSKISQSPVALPLSLVWSELDMRNTNQINEVYEFLLYNYVEDIDAKFRFNYSPELLKWVLLSPGWKEQWIIGVRDDSNRLVGFIGAIPIKIRMHNVIKQMVSIDFLCVHKELRCLGLSPILIREITRRVNLHGGIFQAIYTTGIVLPCPISTARYFHCPLNHSKLVETGFSPPNLEEYVFKSKTSTSILNLRPMGEVDIPQTLKLLQTYLSRFPLSCVFETETEIKHWFLTRQGVVYSFVEEDTSGAITGFVSLYELSSTVLMNSSNQSLRIAYLYYYSHKDLDKIPSLIESVVSISKDIGFDVLNCLNIMNNHVFIDRLGFIPGDGELCYYLFNWKTNPLEPEQIGVLTH
jgi:glycylpeptide N-tetradecanoyltransferase